MTGSGFPIDACPFCGGADFKKFDELRDGIGKENLSKEELADYHAGKWGTLICNNCGVAIDFQQ